MLSKMHRISRPGELSAVHRKGGRSGGQAIAVSVLRTRRPVSRFAFVVSNRVSKRATQRNRLRRQLRGAVHDWLPQIAPGCDIVVTVRAGHPVIPTAQLRAALAQALRRCRLLP
ncbi:MAG: ribonuclease P protein component [Patescibacteria group bacterium]|nr:ribonuclease P protein component [Patescibacteria group bacterium]